MIEWFFLFCLSFIISMLYAKTLLWVMHTDLEEWISFGVGDDIVRAKEHRPEFQFYVNLMQKDNARKNSIPRNTIIEMRKDLKDGLCRPVYFWILWVKLKTKMFSK